ncbi:hypothetical protein Esti_002300 [Eimeria stiedai]
MTIALPPSTFLLAAAVATCISADSQVTSGNFENENGGKSGVETTLGQLAGEEKAALGAQSTGENKAPLETDATYAVDSQSGDTASCWAAVDYWKGAIVNFDSVQHLALYAGASSGSRTHSRESADMHVATAAASKNVDDRSAIVIVKQERTEPYKTAEMCLFLLSSLAKPMPQ